VPQENGTVRRVRGPESQFRSRWPARISSAKSPPGERQRNVAGAHLKWMFTTEKARTKMGCAYPRTDATLDQPAGDGVDLRAPTPLSGAPPEIARRWRLSPAGVGLACSKSRRQGQSKRPL